MTKKKKDNNKIKKCNIKKSCKKKCDKVCSREKVNGEPNLVKPVSQELAGKALDAMPLEVWVDNMIKQRPVSEYYNLETGEIYPKVFLHDSWWIRIKRFLGLIP